MWQGPMENATKRKQLNVVFARSWKGALGSAKPYQAEQNDNQILHRDVAQLGSVLPWGGRGRRFKSCRSDFLFIKSS